MPNSPRPRPSTYAHVPLKTKEKKYPPPSTPHVSVDAIKRALVHTPSPRRFKKLRLRRLQERVRREEAEEAARRVVGATKVEEDEERDGAGGERCEEEGDELDELDLAVLNIGLDDGYVQDDGPLTGDLALQTPKTRREIPDRDELNLYRRPSYEDDGSIQGHEERVRKKKGRRGRKKKKHPRRLPVDELVLGYERVGSLDLGCESDDAGELSHDPISQLSSDDTSPRRTNPALGPPVKATRRRGFGDIDLSQFRLPKARNLFPDHPLPGYSDGFEGQEATPIGRPMPTPHKGGVRTRFYKSRATIGELTLVADRYFGQELQVSYSPPCRQRKSKKLGAEEDRTEVCKPGVVLVADSLPARDEVYHTIEQAEQEYLDDQTETSEVQTLGTISSPLVRKQSLKRRVTFSEMVEEEDVGQLSAMAVPESITKDPSMHNKYIERGDSQKSVLSTGCTEDPTDELDVLQQLAMVSIQKRIDSSDSDESSEEEFFMDDEESSLHLNHEEYDYDALPQMDSGDEGDVDMDYENDPQESELESHHGMEDDIDDESDGIPSYQLEELHERDDEIDAHSEESSEADVWKPRRPRPSNIAMEVDDDIVYSPAPTNRLSSLAIPTPVPRIDDSQESIELGDTQRLLSPSPPPPSPVPETQITDPASYTVMSQGSYFPCAAQRLNDHPGRSLVRRKSVPVSMEAVAIGEESLRTLTRLASVSLGKVDGGRRTVSLPFKPPFKRED